MKLNYKIILSLLISIAFSLDSFSQNKDEKLAINESIEYANSLIWHVNFNLILLRDFQNKLIIWAEDPNRKETDKPEFVFMSFAGKKKNIPQNFDPKNLLFDYNFQLDKINKHVLVFNSLCRRIESSKYSHRKLSDEKRSLEEITFTISNIKKETLMLAETSYDFSRSCAVNYKANTYPTQLAKIKNVVSQSKNLILAIRNNDKLLVKDYLELLTNANNLMEKTTNVRELFILSKSSLTLEENHNLIIEIYHKAFNIASWGETYLQSSFSEDEVNLLLQEVIFEFNEVDGKTGCASGFNTILQFSKHNLMLYTEEPNSIIAENIIPAEKNIDSFVSDTQNETEELDINKNNEPIKEVFEEVFEEKFDENNINSLAGSLPNNLIILLDVSVSMKRSGKLPILKNSISHFLNIMRDEDIISLIAYSGKTQILVSGASKLDKNFVLDTLSKVNSSGGSDVYNALKEAYKIGEKNFIENGNNKIIIASDGIFGIDYGTMKYVKEKTAQNFSLSVFQYSNQNEEVNLKALKSLASMGKGNYKVIYDSNQAIKAMMQEIKKQSVN